MSLRLVPKLLLPGRQQPVRSDYSSGNSKRHWPPTKHCPRNDDTLAADAVVDARQDNDNDVNIEDWRADAAQVSVGFGWSTQTTWGVGRLHHGQTHQKPWSNAPQR